MRSTRVGRRALSAVGVLAVLVLAFAPGSAAGGSGSSSESDTSGSAATATLRDANGVTVGRVVLAPVRGGSTGVAARITGPLAAGFHGFHVHAVGLCEPPSFMTALGHFNPAGTGHGNHAGDLPSLLVTANGSATLALQTDRFTVDALFDADGSAVIVHASPDNFANIPTRYTSSDTPGQTGPDPTTLATGDAGGRVACGVVTRQ
jgi:Cu-Zn family superoxide dismutase